MPNKIGTPGGLNFPYWLETPQENFIVYAGTMVEALQAFHAHRLGWEPMRILQIADNE